MSKSFKGASVELSNLRRKFVFSTNFDSWFTYCVLSQQNSVSVEFVLWTLWLRKYVWIWWRFRGSQETVRGPPPPSIYYYRRLLFNEFGKDEDSSPGNSTTDESLQYRGGWPAKGRTFPWSTSSWLLSAVEQPKTVGQARVVILHIKA